MHVVDMQNCTDFTTTYLPISLFFFFLSSLKYDIFCAPLLLLLSSLHVLWVISRLFSNNGHQKENAKAGKKNWVKMVGGKIYILIMASRATVDFYFGLLFWYRFFYFCLVSFCACLSLSVSFCSCLCLPVSAPSTPKVVGKVGKVGR